MHKNQMVRYILHVCNHIVVPAIRAQHWVQVLGVKHLDCLEDNTTGMLDNSPVSVLEPTQQQIEFHTMIKLL